MKIVKKLMGSVTMLTVVTLGIYVVSLLKGENIEIGLCALTSFFSLVTVWVFMKIIDFLIWCFE